MYKKAITGMMLMNFIWIAGFLCVCGISKNRQASLPVYKMCLTGEIVTQHTDSMLGIVSSTVSVQRKVDVQALDRTCAYQLDEEDWELLCRIVEAEAGNQDGDGRLLVANVVLNRVESEKFPDSVREVVLQKERGVSQFSPVSNGKLWSVTVSEETSQAVERALEGEDISEGALYFASRKYADSEKMKWFDNHLTFLFEHGGHEFFK